MLPAITHMSNDASHDQMINDVSIYNKMLRLLEKSNLQEEFPKQCSWALPSLYLSRSCKKSVCRGVDKGSRLQ